VPTDIRQRPRLPRSLLEGGMSPTRIRPLDEASPHFGFCRTREVFTCEYCRFFGRHVAEASQVFSRTATPQFHWSRTRSAHRLPASGSSALASCRRAKSVGHSVRTKNLAPAIPLRWQMSCSAGERTGEKLANFRKYSSRARCSRGQIRRATARGRTSGGVARGGAFIGTATEDGGGRWSRALTTLGCASDADELPDALNWRREWDSNPR
jgi:hypothetical protein